MTVELGVSIIAVLISIASAVYSRNRLKVAENANSIAVHKHKREILEDLRAFTKNFQENDDETNHEQYSKLKSTTILSKLYFSAQTVAAIRQYEASAAAVLRETNLRELTKIYSVETPDRFNESIEKLVEKCISLAPIALTAVERETSVVAH